MKTKFPDMLAELKSPLETGTRTRAQYDKALATYGTITKHLVGLNDPKEIFSLLWMEWNGRRRASVMKRLHARWCNLRSAYELSAIQSRALVVPSGRRAS